MRGSCSTHSLPATIRAFYYSDKIATVISDSNYSNDNGDDETLIMMVIRTITMNTVRRRSGEKMMIRMTTFHFMIKIKRKRKKVKINMTLILVTSVTTKLR